MDKFVVANERRASYERPKASTPAHGYYAPFTTRLPFLASILVLVLTCVALLELAFQYGTTPEAYKTAASSNSFSKRDILPRQTSVLVASAAPLSGYQAVASPTEQCYVTATVLEIVEIISSDGSAVPTSTIYSSDIPTGTGEDCLTVTMSAVSTSYLTIATPSSPGVSATSTAPVSTSGAYEAISSPTACYVTATVVEILSVYSTDGSATTIGTLFSTHTGTVTTAGCATEYVTTTSLSYIAIQSAATSDPGAYVANSSPVTSSSSQGADQGSYVKNSSPPPTHKTTLESVAQYSYVTLTPAPSSITPIEGSTTFAPVTQISDGSAYVAIVTPSSTIVVSEVVASASSSSWIGDASGAKISYMVVSTESPSIGSTGAQPMQYVTVIAIQPSPASEITTTTHGAASSTGSTPKVLPTLVESQLQLGKHFNDGDYFLASYLAVFVTVVLKEMWSIVFASTKMMEPFYQLQTPRGASAPNSLLANYLSTWLSWRSVQAVFGGQWVMMFTTITYAFFAVLSPIATECMATLPTAWCATSNNGRQPCLPVWLLNKPFARVLQAVLSAIALCIIVLIAINSRRKSGLHSNPSSLASMAALLNNEEVIEEIRALDPHANDKAIAKALTGSAYRIEYHTSLNGTHYYGLAKPDSVLAGNHNRYGSIANPHNMSLTNHAPARGTFASRALRDSLFLLVISALFGVVLGYYLDHSADPFNHFFNSGTFGPRFLLTSCAVLIGLHWKTLEREVRILTPYRRLSERHARPENTILVTLNGTPLTALPGALRRGDIFHATIAFVAICSDLLIIAIAGVPFNRSQVWKAFIASAASSLTILGMMILAIFALFWWRIQNERMRMPREPDTLMAVCMMLCNEGNGVRRMMEGMELLEEKVRDMRVKEEGGVFYAGEVHEEMGGRGRWVVDVGDAAEGKVVGYG